MYDPIELSKKTEEIVVRGKSKKYYRFRPTRFYGGISTADTVGCNLRCVFCWSSSSVWNAPNSGIFYTPEEVSSKLCEISSKKNFRQVRISGGEPTIGKTHLIELLKLIPDNLLFILETNGVLLGYDESYVSELSKFKNMHVRVCLKGATSEEFKLLTSAKNGFEYQLKALENLRDENVNFNIALVSVSKDKHSLYERLQKMELGKIMIENEEIILYPKVKNRLQKLGLLDLFS
jgi:uncharacterized Fe-S cluster-containing radical SAM superfamily protein